jgi:hypothetical protein
MERKQTWRNNERLKFDFDRTEMKITQKKEAAANWQ